MITKLIAAIRIDFASFAVTRGGLFDLGIPAPFEAWPSGRPAAPAPALTATGGICMPDFSRWQQWTEWWANHHIPLYEAFPTVTTRRGGITFPTAGFLDK